MPLFLSLFTARIVRNGGDCVHISPSSLSVGWKIEWRGFSPKVREASVGRGAGGGRASSLFPVDDNLLDDIHPVLLCAWMRSLERRGNYGMWMLTFIRATSHMSQEP